MSLHVIEDMVSESVLVLDAHYPADDERVRDWLVALYAFQAQFDTSDTQGRVHDILIRRRMIDYVPPRRVPVLDAVAAVAEKTDDAGLVACWHALGYETLIDGVVLDVDDLAAMPAVQRLRAAMDRTGGWDAEVPAGHRPTDEEVEAMDDELETWWYQRRPPTVHG